MTYESFVSIRIESGGAPWGHARVRRLSGREAIGQLFSFDVDVVCDPDHDLPEGVVPGEDVTLVFELAGNEVRRVHGMLGPVRAHVGAAETAAYRLRVVPRALRLSLVETQEIFLDQTVPEMIKSKLERHGFAAADFELRLMGSYAAREIVVQYQESDLAFVSRLAEHAGIGFYFEHEDGRDRMVFTDHEGGYRPLAGAGGAAEVAFSGRGEKAGVFALDRVSDLAPTSYIVQDYNYRTPQVDLSACADLESGNGGGVVEYGGHVKTPAEAERLARVRAEERRARQLVYEGKSGVMALSAGRPAKILEVPRTHAPLPLLVVEVTHDATIPVFSEHETEKADYSNDFRAVPRGFVYRPARATPRPRIAGVITGVIQPGPEGETGGVARIDADGRYTVELHLDTAKPGARKSSHPMRMAQPFAGPGYGMHLPLRRGTEVLVAFANGDPDRPVILGAVYNAASPSPVVASSATKHRIQTSAGVLFELGSKS
jgi:type VI secretion system secreted protein VgrG